MEIEFKHVDYTYNHQLSAHNVLNDINVKFKPHKINAIIGSSGSGKTTMLEMINALLLPTKGEVQVDTYKLTSGKKIPMINNLRFDVGLVFQFPEEQFFNPTVKQEIKFGMKYFAYKLDHIDQRCSDALKLVGLDDSYLDKNPFNLSSGQKRKVAIASVLAFNPKVIILDEPTVGLDAKSKNHIKRLLRLLCNRYHKTVIIVSHDLDLVYELSDYIVLLDHGHVVLNGNKKEVFANYKAFDDYNILMPKLIEFTRKAYELKGIELAYHDDIKELIKEIYRNV